MKLSKGFSLIELLVVFVVIGILLSIGGTALYPSLHRYETTGVISGIDKMAPALSIGGGSVGNTTYAFSVDITTDGGDIISFSSEDRKFATCEKGQKIKAVYLKYPPWMFSKAGTFYNGRMIKKYAQ